MRCHEVRRRLIALVDGELSASVAEDVYEHLAACSACEAEAGRLASVELCGVRMPDDVVGAPLLEHLTSSVMDTYDQLERSGRLHPRWWEGRLPQRSKVVRHLSRGAAAALVAATLGLVGWNALQPADDTGVAPDGAFVPTAPTTATAGFPGAQPAVFVSHVPMRSTF